MLIDAFDDSALETLERLHSDMDEHGHLYVVIDGAFIPGIHRDFSAALGEPVRLLFDTLPGLTEETRDISPFVFEYDPAVLVIPELIMKCRGYPMVSAIESTCSFGEVALRLEAWTIVANDGLRFNFRFTDTRRLPAILGILTNEQLGSLVGDAVAWHYIGREGRLLRHALCCDSKPIASRPQNVSREQFAALVEEGEADAMLARLASSGAVLSDLPSTNHLRVTWAMEAAALHGLEANKVFEWCEVCSRQEISDLESAQALLVAWRDEVAKEVRIGVMQ